MELVTIPISHFCEKARWGLDRAGLAYTEKPCAPVLHRARVMPRGSKTAPILIDGRDVVRGSTAILERCDRDGDAPALFPADPDRRREVDELVDRFDKRLGPPMRAWLYSWAVEHPGDLLRYCTLGVSTRQRRVVHATLPAIGRLLRLALRLTPSSHEESARRVDAELQFVGELLSDGRTYLAGDAFSAADLTFAALFGAAVSAPEYGGGRFALPDPPGPLAAEIAAWRQTAAGNFALAIYRDWR